MSRRGFTTLLALGISSSSALAADLDAPPTQLDMGSITSPTSASRWQGAYGGVVLGAIASPNQSGTQFWWPQVGPPYVSTDQPSSVTLSSYGGSVGLQLGFDTQWGPLVLGAVADTSLVVGSQATRSGSGSFASDYSGFPSGTYTSSFSQQLNSFGTFRARVGYAPNSDWMVYGTGGLAFGQVNVSNTVNLTSADVVSNSRSALAVGYTVGAGAQYALSSQYSIGLEGLYYNLGSQDNVSVANFYTFSSLPSGGELRWPFSPQVVSKTNFSGFQLRLTGVYEFDGGGDAVKVGGMSTDPNTDVPVEFGMRAGASFGQTQTSLYNGDGSALVSRLTYHDSNALTVEPFFKFEVPNWGLFVTGYAGVGALQGTTLQDEDFPPGVTPYSSTTSSVSDSTVDYATVDIGYYAWQDSWYKVGGFLGFNYIGNVYNASGCNQTASNTAICYGGPSVTGISPNNVVLTDSYSWSAVRLGLAGTVTLAHGLSASASAAWLPYVSVTNTDDHWLRMPGDFGSGIPGSGTGYASYELEGKTNYALTPNFDIGAGLRYWSLSANGHINFQDVYSYTGGGYGSSQVAKFTTQQTQAFLETGYHF